MGWKDIPALPAPIFPNPIQAGGSKPNYAGAAALLQKKVIADQAFTPEDVANAVRDPIPPYPGAAVGIGRIDPSHPVIQDLLKNLPPDIEYLPEHESGPILRLIDKQVIPTS